MNQETKILLQGGAFLIESVPPQEMFTPEDFSEEQKMIAKTTEEFVQREVLPNIERIEKQDFKFIVSLIRKAGESGLLSVSIPQEYEGLDLDTTCSMLVTENLCAYGSFAVTHGAHTSIGTLPILYFGNDAQKKKYLPLSCSAEKIFAYALTEAGSGSDALAAKTTAVLNPEGTHYICNGEKMYITNASFADVFVTFVKVDGDKFSGLIIERDMPGVSTGKEERKMGIHGSSTCTLILQDAKIPKENLLGQVGRGHKIAFNILNFGRFKLGAGSLGGSKSSLKDAIKYASERKQFKTAIAEFGAIQHKLAEMATQIYALESAVYRTSGLLDTKLSTLNKNDFQEVLDGIEEYAVECSTVKVFGSEVLDYVTDEHVQILGGYGYIHDYSATRFYLDSRINRIFEGTNEINRMLIPGMLLKKATKGKLPLLKAAQGLLEEILNYSGEDEEDLSLLSGEKKRVQNAKKIVLLVLGSAAQKFMKNLEQQQEILIHLADLVIQTYAMEASLLRCLKMISASSEEKCAITIAMTQIFLNDTIQRIEFSAKQALPAIADGDELRILLSALKRFTKFTPINTIELRRKVAHHLLETGQYCPH
ncbi:MAG: acyl-CoA dehydrogenase family protein [Planctomycetota bacterium]